MHASRPALLAASMVALTLAACGDSSTEPAALRAVRVEGRAYDVATDSGVPGVEVGVVSDGLGITLTPAVTDASGAYRISEDFAIDLLCTPGRWQLAANLPAGWTVVPSGEALECTEATQVRDITLTRASTPN